LENGCFPGFSGSFEKLVVGFQGLIYFKKVLDPGSLPFFEHN